MTRAILLLFLWTLVPTLELRFSIPYGWIEHRALLGAAGVVAVCVVANVLLAPVVWVFLDRVMQLFLRVPWIERLFEATVERSRSRLQPYIERYGTVGLALFIGIPLPGSGVYSGALGAYVLGFNFRQFLAASMLGVVIAGAAVTAVTATGATAFDVFVKH